MDINSREGRNHQWLLIQVLLRENKFEEAEKELEERIEHYIVSRRLIDDRILQRSILRSLQREADILPLLEADIRSGDKVGWDIIDLYFDALYTRIISRSSSLVLPPAEAASRAASLAPSTPHTREDYLFLLEAASRAAKNGGSPATLSERAGDYWAAFGHKGCCAQDLQRWLAQIATSGANGAIMQKVESELTLTVSPTGVSLEGILARKASALRIFLGISGEAADWLLKETWRLYLAGMAGDEASARAKEITAVDDAAMVLADALAGSLRGKIQTCALLRNHLTKRP